MGWRCGVTHRLGGAHADSARHGVTLLFAAQRYGEDIINTLLGCGVGFVRGLLFMYVTAVEDECLQALLEIVKEDVSDIDGVTAIGGHAHERGSEGVIEVLHGKEDELARGRIGVDLTTALESRLGITGRLGSNESVADEDGRDREQAVVVVFLEFLVEAGVVILCRYLAMWADEDTDVGRSIIVVVRDELDERVGVAKDIRRDEGCHGVHQRGKNIRMVFFFASGFTSNFSDENIKGTFPIIFFTDLSPRNQDSDMIMLIPYRNNNNTMLSLCDSIPSAPTPSFIGKVNHHPVVIPSLQSCY